MSGIEIWEFIQKFLMIPGVAVTLLTIISVTVKGLKNRDVNAKRETKAALAGIVKEFKEIKEELNRLKNEVSVSETTTLDLINYTEAGLAKINTQAQANIASATEAMNCKLNDMDRNFKEFVEVYATGGSALDTNKDKLKRIFKKPETDRNLQIKRKIEEQANIISKEDRKQELLKKLEEMV